MTRRTVTLPAVEWDALLSQFHSHVRASLITRNENGVRVLRLPHADFVRGA